MLPKASWGDFEHAAPVERLDLPARSPGGPASAPPPSLVPLVAQMTTGASHRPSSRRRRDRPRRSAGRPAARTRLQRARDHRPGRAPARRPGVRRRPGTGRGGRRLRLVRQPRHRPPVAESLRSTMDWFRDWLDDVAPAGGRWCWSASAAAPRSPAGWSGRPGRMPARDPVRHAALRRRFRTTPAGSPGTRFRGAGRRRHGDPSRAARPHLGLPAAVPARPRSRGGSPAATSSPRARCASSGTGSPNI